MTDFNLSDCDINPDKAEFRAASSVASRNNATRQGKKEQKTRFGKIGSLAGSLLVMLALLPAVLLCGTETQNGGPKSPSASVRVLSVAVLPSSDNLQT